MTVFDLNNLNQSSSEPQRKPSLLLVDDCPRNLRLTAKLLSDKFDVLTADSAQAALDLVEKLPQERWLEVAICDQQLPPNGGSTLVQQLQAQNGDTLAILLCSSVGNQNTGQNEGRIFRTLHKPVDPDHLLRSVDEALNVYHQRRELLTQADALTMEIQVISETLAEKKLTLDRLMDNLAKLGKED